MSISGGRARPRDARSAGLRPGLPPVAAVERLGGGLVSTQLAPYSYNQAQIGSLEPQPDSTLVVGSRNRTVDSAFPVTANEQTIPTQLSASAQILWPLRLAPPHHDGCPCCRAEEGRGGVAWLPSPPSTTVEAAVRSPTRQPGRRTTTTGPCSSITYWYGSPAPVNGREIVVVGEELGLGDVEALCPRSADKHQPRNLRRPPAGRPLLPLAVGLTIRKATTAAVTLTPTATPTVSPTASATRTPRPGRIYLPVQWANAWCTKSRRPLDLVFVLDMSRSMGRPTREGRGKADGGSPCSPTNCAPTWNGMRPS